MGEQLSVLREFERQGKSTLFQKPGLSGVQGREMTPSAPVSIEALAFKIQDTASGDQLWLVERRPFDQAGHSFRGPWTLDDGDGVAHLVELTEWGSYFEARLTVEGPS